MSTTSTSEIKYFNSLKPSPDSADRFAKKSHAQISPVIFKSI